MQVQSAFGDDMTMMMAELNHRLFNSFQVIAALARRCSKADRHDELRPMLGELDDRLIAFADVHRSLSRAGAADGVVEQCRRTSASLVKAFGRQDRILLDVGDVRASADITHRISLIVAELVTNILKHSFRDANNQTIHLRLRSDLGNIEILAWDSAPATDPTGPAPRFVSMLARSLGGCVNVFDRNGYAVQVLIPQPPVLIRVDVANQVNRCACA